MPTIDQYQTNDAKIRLLLQGPPGTAKTTTACQFPKAWVFDLDVNLGGPLRYLKNHGLPLPVGYDRFDVDATGKEVPMAQRYGLMTTAFSKVINNPDVESLIIDSGTRFFDILWAETERQQPGCKDGRQMWGFFARYTKIFFGLLIQAPKHVVMIFHEKTETNELDQTIKEKVAWPGQTGDYIGAFFTDVWRAEVKMVPKGLTTEYVYQLRTLSDARHDLKNSFEFPPTFTFDWKVIEAKLKGTTK